MGILDKLMFWKKEDEFADIGLGDKENLPFGDQFGTPPGGANPPGLGSTPGMDQGGMAPGSSPAGSTPPQPSMPSFGAPSPQPQYSPQPSYNPQQDLESKNLEVISSKLDAIRASIESLNQRLANLEAIARGEEEQGRRKRYY